MTVPKTRHTFPPLTCLQSIANVRHEWVALLVRFDGPHFGACSTSCAAELAKLIEKYELLDAIGSLQCVVPVSDPVQLRDDVIAILPTDKVIICVPQACCAESAAQEKLRQLAGLGFRIYLDGLPLPATELAFGARGFALDCGNAVPAAAAQWLGKLDGPCLARNVDDPARFTEAAAAGFGWFAGEYPLHPSVAASRNEGTSRARLLKLLCLVARDADSRDLEVLLKQDPALSYHLLKLVNSAAFALANPITSFGQAINVLGRRQLQRWLQLLLYSRQQGDDGMANPLLPRAALRASFMEALCENTGGDKQAQDHAFMVGMFSLLDVLFAMPMEEVIKSLSLDNVLVEALLRHEGELGGMLNVVERSTCERTPLAQLTLVDSQIDNEIYLRSMVQAYRWAIQVSREI